MYVRVERVGQGIDLRGAQQGDDLLLGSAGAVRVEGGVTLAAAGPKEYAVRGMRRACAAEGMPGAGLVSPFAVRFLYFPSLAVLAVAWP